MFLFVFGSAGEVWANAAALAMARADAAMIA
jgi:hypothetical protein